MKKLLHLLPAISMLVLFSCASDAERNLKSSYATEEVATDEWNYDEPSEGAFEKAGSSEESKVDVKKTERKLIKEGSISFETDDMAKSRKQIMDAVKQFNGYTSSDRENKYSGKYSQTIEVRVPSKHFDAFLASATKDVGNFDAKNIDIKDVSEEFVDIQARLKSKKEMEKRYLELLKEAKNVTEMLEVEKELGQLRSDIESFEGRLNYLSDRVSFSTVSITFYQSVAKENKFGSKFKRGFRNGWEGLIYFFIGMVNAWPFILMVIAGVIVFRRWRKRRRVSKQ